MDGRRVFPPKIDRPLSLFLPLTAPTDKTILEKMGRLTAAAKTEGDRVSRLGMAGKSTALTDLTHFFPMTGACPGLGLDTLQIDGCWNFL